MKLLEGELDDGTEAGGSLVFIAYLAKVNKSQIQGEKLFQNNSDVNL